MVGFHEHTMVDDEHIIPGTLVDDPKMAAEDRDAIELLSPSESESAWDTLVARKHGHLMRLPADTWPARLMAETQSLYDWHDDWNNSSAAAMQHLLSEMRPPSRIIYVFWSRSTAVRTTQSILARNWINFLYEDEGVIIRSPEDEIGTVISSSRIWSSAIEA
jgi:hypothetical protein